MSTFESLLKITYLVHFLLETLFEHLVCFVQDYGLQSREVNVAALNVVKDSAARAHKEVDAMAE